MLTLVIVSVTAMVWLVEITLAPQGGLELTIIHSLATGLTAISIARVLELLIAAALPNGGLASLPSERLRSMIRILLYVAATLIWAHYIHGIDVTGLLATSAIATLILGLALQATLGNLFAGLSLEFERPIRVGDYIRKGTVEGQVAALRWRSVFIRTIDDTQIIVPNNALSSEPFQVIRRSVPSRLQIKFCVSSNVPPTEVMMVTNQVLTSGLHGICLEPPPSISLLGAEKQQGTLTYAARFYTIDWLDRSSTRSALWVRLWYALSRKGITLEPDARQVWISGDHDRSDTEIGHAAGLPWTAPGRHRQGQIVSDMVSGPGLRDQILAFGQRLRYGPGESIDLGGGIAIVVAGAAREQLRQGEGTQETARALDAILQGSYDPALPPLVAGHSLEDLAARAAVTLGPIAHTLARTYGARTDDPYLLAHALASQIRSAEDRARFLAHTPAFPSRHLPPGTLFGGAAALGLEAPDARNRLSDHGVEIVLLKSGELRRVLAHAEDASAVLAATDPMLAGLTAADLQQWIEAS